MTSYDHKQTKKAVESVQRLCGSDLDSYQTHLQCSCQMSPKYQVMKPRRLRASSDRPLNPSHLNPLAPTILDEQMLKIDLESLTDDCGSYSTKKKLKKIETFLLSRRFEILGLRPRISYRKRLNSAHKARYDPFYLPYASGI